MVIKISQRINILTGLDLKLNRNYQKTTEKHPGKSFMSQI